MSVGEYVRGKDWGVGEDKVRAYTTNMERRIVTDLRRKRGMVIN